MDKHKSTPKPIFKEGWKQSLSTAPDTANSKKIQKTNSSTQTESRISRIGCEFTGRSLSNMAAHLQDLADLLYENQDKLGNHRIILGTEILLEAYAAELKETSVALGWTEDLEARLA